MGLMKTARGLSKFTMDCGFWRSRRLAGASLAAIGLQTAGVGYCNEHATDGLLPRRGDLAVALGIRERDAKGALKELLERGVWTEDAGELQVVGFLDHNPSRRQVGEHAAQRTAAATKANHTRWHEHQPEAGCPWCEDAPPTRSDSQSNSESESRIGSESDPDRSPVPDPTTDPMQCRAVQSSAENEDLPPHAPPAPGVGLALVLGTASPPATGRGDPVRVVFEAWQESTGHRKAVLDDKRRRVIRRALANFPVEDCVDAVRGWRHSPHHRGENRERTVHDGLELLLRDAEHLERFRDLERNERERPDDRRPPSAAQQRQQSSYDAIDAVFGGAS